MSTDHQQPSDQRFSGKTVLVTGGSGGIGSEICRRLAAAGARVWLHFSTGTERAERALAALDGDGHRMIQADLTDADAVASMAEQVIGTGKVDVLVNNAGIFVKHPPLDVDYQTWQQHWRRTLDVNLTGAANLSYCIGRHMAEHGGGRIVNISSRGAFRGEPECPAYGASKAGLNALTQSLAFALAPRGVFVYAVAPGFVETAMARPYLTSDMAEAIKQQSPLGRVATAGDVAYWVLCLAADGAEFATGAIVDVNGASYLRT